MKTLASIAILTWALAAHAAEPQLTVTHDVQTGDVTLSWSGGLAPYEVYGSDDPTIVGTVTSVLTTTFGTSYVDTSFGSDVTFYRVGSVPVCTESQAVSYTVVGNGSCNFVGEPNAPELPALALDEFQYNTLFTGEGYGTAFGAGDAFRPAGEGRACGACLEVTGVNGSIVGMVREIADIAAVGSLGYPTTVHIDGDVNASVRDFAGAAVDVTLRPVPCPISGNIQIRSRIYNPTLSFGYWLALEYVVYNHRDPVVMVEIKAEQGHDQWYPLTPEWTGRFEESNTSPTTYGVIPLPDPPNGPIRLRLTSLYGDVVVTDAFQQPDRPVSGASGDSVDVYFDSGVQFPPRSVPDGPCAPNVECGNWVVDDDEECEFSQQQSIDCGQIGAGSGTAFCDPTTCLWDRGGCSMP